MKKIFFSIIILCLFFLSGCVVNTYKVSFVSDDEIIEVVSVKSGETATRIEDPLKENYDFIGWYNNDQEFDFNTKITSDLTLTAKWESSQSYYVVRFFGFNNELLKEETVKEGESAKEPIIPNVKGYKFVSWDNDFSNVTSDIDIKAIYEVDKTIYKINYNLNGGSWGYTSKDEYIAAFLNDFYSFVSPSETKNTFINGTSNTSGFDGTWTNYVGGSFDGENKLLYNNDIDANNDEYFFNSSSYKDKWYNLSSWVKNKICAKNNRFGGSGGYTYGILDFYRYIISDPAGYISVYGDGFYTYPSLNEPTVLTYTTLEDVLLNIPLSSNFEGWYFNEDLSGENVKKIEKYSQGDITLYAKWKEVITFEISFDSSSTKESYESITVEYNEEVNLPTPSKDGYCFIGWYYNDTLINNTFNYNYNNSIELVAKWKATSYELEALSYDGTNVTYRNSSTVVTIPNQYVQPTKQLRAAWVSSYAGDFDPSTSKDEMIKTLTEILDLLESYNMNCMIFHIRTHNNAFYKTRLAPIKASYGTYESFEKWDYLTWLIDECHKRGIEFHAWLNPYRIKSSGYSLSTTTSDVASEYVNYPDNPASNPDNILMTYYRGTSQGAILDPAKEEVQDYIVKVCLEVMQNYDVDAIHFDDYFYAQMSSGITVLTEPDQAEYETYCDTDTSFSKTSASDKKEWRRTNVSNFIYKLHNAMTSFNSQYKRDVQLGISPTGIYKNGNGSVSSGSNTAGQEHYNSYLFCDSKQWVLNEWIDYILPQSYWAFTHKVAGYADVMDWWDKVVEGTNVNLYSGIGLYMSSGGNYSWGTQNYEVSNQILYTTKLKNCKGVSFYNISSLKEFGSDSSSVQYKGLQKVKEYWNTKVSTPNTMASQYAN